MSAPTTRHNIDMADARAARTHTFEVSVFLDSSLDIFPTKLIQYIEDLHTQTITRYVNNMYKDAKPIEREYHDVVISRAIHDSGKDHKMALKARNIPFESLAVMELLKHTLPLLPPNPRFIELHNLEPLERQGVIDMYSLRLGEVGWNIGRDRTVTFFLVILDDLGQLKDRILWAYDCGGEEKEDVEEPGKEYWDF